MLTSVVISRNAPHTDSGLWHRSRGPSGDATRRWQPHAATSGQCDRIVRHDPLLVQPELGLLGTHRFRVPAYRSPDGWRRSRRRCRWHAAYQE